MMERFDDQEFEDHKIIKVLSWKEGWPIATDKDREFFIEKRWGIKPKVGQSVRCYGERQVRGLFINGRECFYRTPEQEEGYQAEQAKIRENEQKTTFEKERAELNVQYEALPEVFRRRIDKFRKNNPDFRWEFEACESFVCTQAVAIAEALKTPEAIVAWSKKSSEQQQRKVPTLSDDHSGTTFVIACRLAILYLQNPEDVIKLHGVLTPLVGSEKYGDVPRRKQ